MLIYTHATMHTPAHQVCVYDRVCALGESGWEMGRENSFVQTTTIKTSSSRRMCKSFLFTHS